MSLSLTIGSGITFGSGIAIGSGTPSSVVPPTINTQGIWAFDPNYIGQYLSLGFLANANMRAVANSPETSIVLGLLDGGNKSLYDIGHRVMFSVYVSTEDPQDIPLKLARVGLANQNVNLDNGLGGSDGNSVAFVQDGTVEYNGSTQISGSGLPTFGPGDYIDVAVDTSINKMWIRVNGGNWNGNPSANPATQIAGIDTYIGTGDSYGGANAAFPAIEPGAENYVDAFDIETVTYSIPSGFTAI